MIRWTARKSGWGALTPIHFSCDPQLLFIYLIPIHVIRHKVRSLLLPVSRPSITHIIMRITQIYCAFLKPSGSLLYQLDLV